MLTGGKKGFADESETLFPDARIKIRSAGFIDQGGLSFRSFPKNQK
jgi:hypothetical protein